MHRLVVIWRESGVDDRDDTLDDKGGDVLKLEVVKGGKPADVVLSDSCEDTLLQMDEVREQITSGRLTSMILFAITSDGLLTRNVLSKNRFELIGLAREVEKLIDEDVVNKVNPD